MRLSRGALLAGFLGLALLLVFSVVGFPGRQAPTPGPLAEGRTDRAELVSSTAHGAGDVVQWGVWLAPNASDDPVTLERVELAEAAGVTLLDARVVRADDGGISLEDGEPDPSLAPVDGFEIPGSPPEDEDGEQPAWQLVLVVRLDGPAGSADAVDLHYRQGQQDFVARYDGLRLELGNAAMTADTAP
ncbi:MAG: hypothetical protein S0880_26545 [Actinomycetota bacterium]|nr:hypothetical protein [Actinomycetota bacterium]